MGKPRKNSADEAEELRAVIREGHELLQDLRATHKDLRTLHTEVIGMIDGIPAKVDARIETAVVDGLEILGREMKAAMEQNVAGVGKQFERLESILMGTDKDSQREGKPSLEQLLRERRALALQRDRIVSP
ncbi:hypothetical protein [Herbidospora sp. RD11066]